MNRQTKRLMQRQGQLGADGAAAPPRRPPTRPTSAGRGGGKPPSERSSPAQFLRGVRGELRKVAWPTRAEVVNYSTIVLLTLAVTIALIFVLDYAFANGVLYVFET